MHGGNGETLRVLVAEDDQASGRLISAAIRKLGYEVILAANGRDAWYSYVGERPRIVITDWMMPVIDGIELSRRIRADGRSHYTYLIMLTALDGKDRHAEGMRAGVDDFMTKPLDLDILRVRLTVAERILGLQRRVAELRGLLPICSYCKRIRNDDGSWQDLEAFVGARTNASFSHLLCPTCAEKAS
jgi:DNA-binding response OmpR family regulator